jgi:hypothetical protein
MIDHPVDPPPSQWTVSPQKVKFAGTIRVIVAELENERGKVHAIPLLIRQHQIKRRRLYDVTNVFIAIGCATRSGPDDIRWEGVSEIMPRLLQEKGRLNLLNYQIKLAELFPPDTCVGLMSLTVSFIMLFPALGTDMVNLRDASAFFSRDTRRYKTTLSKLYQITLILGALEITERTENPSEVRLKAPFTALIADETGQNPLAIEKLLNRPIRNSDALEARRAEFHAAIAAVGIVGGRAEGESGGLGT